MSDITFTRGDTQYFEFELKDKNENKIILEDTDRLYFTVKQNSNSQEVLLQKYFPLNIEYENGLYKFSIESKDTAKMNYGTYSYDIELKSGDFVKTLLFGTLTLTEEITFKEDEK